MGTQAAPPLEVRFRERFRLDAGWLAGALRELTAGDGLALGELVDRTGVPASSLRELLRVVPEAFERDGATIMLSAAGRQLASGLGPTPAEPPAAFKGEAVTAQLAYLRGLRERRPAPDRQRDQVPATEETLVHRAELLTRAFDLRGRRVLFLGDADLTSLALARVCPQARIAVLDVDERVLRFVGEETRALGCEPELWGADLRIGLPASLRGTCDLVFTDPPYADAGMELFLARAAAALEPRDGARIAFCYGVSAAARERALAIQQAAQDLGLVFEQVLPGFNAYRGARVLGSRSALYVCVATERTPGSLARIERRAPATDDAYVYTGGAQRRSARGGRGRPSALAPGLHERLAALGGDRTIVRFGPPLTSGPERDAEPLPLGALLAAPGQAAQRSLRGYGAALVHVSPGSEQTLLRVALALAALPTLLVWDPRTLDEPPFDAALPRWQLVTATSAVDRALPRVAGQESALLTPRAAADGATPAEQVLRRAVGHAGAARSALAEALIALERAAGRALAKRPAGELLQAAFGGVLPPGRLVELPPFVLDRLVVAAEQAVAELGHA